MEKQTATPAPVVSICSLSFNHASYIRQALDSFLAQQCSFPVEIIVHDDASTDGTAEILQDYMERYPQQVRAILQKDNQFSKDPSSVVRTVYQAARGRYFAAGECDDYWTDPLKLQKQVQALDSNPEAAGCFGFIQVRYEESGELGAVYGQHGGQLSFGLEDTISRTALCHPAGFMFRSSALGAFPAWFQDVLSSDMAVLTLVASHGSLICLPEMMGIYRKHGQGITNTSAHVGNAYHLNRINLWLYVDRHFRYRYHVKCMELFRYHWQHICWHSTPRQRLANYAWLLRRHKAWFMRWPGIAWSRLVEVVRP